MSSRALRALQTSLGKEAAAELFPSRGVPPTTPLSRGSKGSSDQDADAERSGEGAARSKTNTKAETSKAEKEPLAESLRSVQGNYDMLCFIFSIHSKQEIRSFHDLQQAFHQLCGRKIKLDELRLLKTVYPNGMTFSYKGLSSKRLSEDLQIQIPKRDGQKCFDEHKRNFALHLERCATQLGGDISGLDLDALPVRSSKNSLEESEKFVRKVIKSYSPVKSKVAEASSSPSSTKIKSFFQTNKLISKRSLHLVQQTHDKKRKLFDESELEARRQRRNLSQLPVLFDRLRGLFRGLNRRAMPMREVLSQLMSMRKDRTILQSDLEQQIALIIRHAGDWCNVESDTKKNKIFSLKPTADPNAVRRKLNLLSKQQQ
jgi:hypothetical protein